MVHACTQIVVTQRPKRLSQKICCSVQYKYMHILKDLDIVNQFVYNTFKDYCPQLLCSTDFGLSYAKKGELLPYIIKVRLILTTVCFVLFLLPYTYFPMSLLILQSFAVDSLSLNLKNINPKLLQILQKYNDIYLFQICSLNYAQLSCYRTLLLTIAILWLF